MNGRELGNIKIHNSIRNGLQGCPDYVVGFYYDIEKTCTAASCKDFVNKIKAFVVYLHNECGITDPEDITLDVFNQYMSKLKYKINKKGEMTETSSSYRYATWCALNRFFDYLEESERIEKNFIRGKRRIKCKDAIPTVQIKKKDMIRILDNVKNGVGSDLSKVRQELYKNRDLAIMMLFAYTGMRVTALTQIDIDDIIWNENKIRIIDKGDKYHEYFLDEKLMEQIKAWMKDRKEKVNPGENALFISDRGIRMTSKCVYDLTYKYAGVSPHKLRAGFATILHDNGMDIRDIAVAGGWSNIQTAARYIRGNEEAKVKAKNIMSKIYG